MNEKLRSFIDSVFEGAPETQKTTDLKEEMLQNLTDKYNDLISEGKSEEAAYNLTVASVGDVGALIKKLHSENGAAESYESIKNRQTSAILTSTAVALYICSVIPCILLPGSLMGPVLLFLLVAIATALMIYNAKMKPHYKKTSDTVVEEFREWRSENSGKKEVFKAVTSALWAITVVVYMLVSFQTGAWHITWVIFLISSAINGIIKALFDLSK